MSYDLVVGQGRLETYIAFDQEEIPAIVVTGTKEDLLLMSLAENVALRQHSTVELVRDIRPACAGGPRTHGTCVMGGSPAPPRAESPSAPRTAPLPDGC